jgi:hypothetical protein
MVYDMCMQYCVDGNSDLHLLGILYFLFSKLKSGELTTDVILHNFGQSCIDMIFIVCDHVGEPWDSGLILEENYLLDELSYINKMGKYFTMNESRDSEDLQLWEKLKTVFFNN